MSSLYNINSARETEQFEIDTQKPFTEANSYDYTMASNHERMRTIYPGDPVGDYYGFSDIQKMILSDEATNKRQGADQISGMLSVILSEAIQSLQNDGLAAK